MDWADGIINIPVTRATQQYDRAAQALDDCHVQVELKRGAFPGKIDPNAENEIISFLESFVLINDRVQQFIVLFSCQEITRLLWTIGISVFVVNV